MKDYKVENHTFIIAEAGVNHNGSLDLAYKLIDAAKESGADAVKFQSFQASQLVTASASQADYQRINTASEKTQYELLKELELLESDFKELKSYCEKREIHFLSTPFDKIYLNYLVDILGMDTIKIPSGEVTNGPFLLDIAKKKKKIILSTGMCNIEEIQQALSILAFGLIDSGEKPSKKGFSEAYLSIEGQTLLKEKVCVLHCTTEYPAPFDEINLNVLKTFKTYFNGMRVGYSDHSLDIFVPLAAIAMGASVIEKHFTLNKALPGPDHLASLDPLELKEMVRGIRCIEKALGTDQKTPTTSELKNRSIARRSLMALQPILKGQTFSESNISFKRPGTGISPMKYWDLIGKPSHRNYEVDELIEEY